jgi:hypothetical protein
MSSIALEAYIGTPRTYGYRYTQFASNFVLKDNPEVFGPLNMHQNGIYNLADGKSLQEAVNLQQLNSATVSVLLGSELVSTNNIPNISNVDQFRFMGIPLNPLTGQAIYAQQPVGTDVLSFFPGICTSLGVMPTNWQLIETSSPTVAGFAIGANNVSASNTGIPTPIDFNCNFTCSIVGVSTMRSVMCLFNKLTGGTVANIYFDISASQSSYAIRIPGIGINSLMDFENFIVAIRMFVPTGTTVSMNDVALSKLWLTYSA